MDVHEDDSHDSWLHLQVNCIFSMFKNDRFQNKPLKYRYKFKLKATCNIKKSFFNDWFTGHLNFQIEHQ